MKLSKAALLLSVLTLSVGSNVAFAGGNQFKAVDKSRPSQLCVVAAQGNRAAMNIQIKESGWSKKFVVENVTCNLESIGQFVAKYSSDSMKRYIPANTSVNIIDVAQNSQFSGLVTVSK